MMYDVLDMSNRSFTGQVRYQYPSITSPPRPRTILQEEEDQETGDTIIRRLPQSIPVPDSHYVIMRNSGEEVAWQIYAGPFPIDKAIEIAAALQAKADTQQ